MNERKAPPALGAYAQSVTAQGLCFVSGQAPVDENGNDLPEGNVTRQAEQVFENIESCLAEANLTMSDLVSITTYLRDATDYAEIAAVRNRYLGHHRPTSTVVEVSNLLHPSWRLEVGAIAAVPTPQ